MHPRGEFTRHYVVPGLTARGYAVFGQNSRYLNNDTDMVHERLLFDIAAGMRHLKERGLRAHRAAGQQRRRLAALVLPVAGVAHRPRAADSHAGRRAHRPHGGGDAGGRPVHRRRRAPGEGRFMLNVLDPASSTNTTRRDGPGVGHVQPGERLPPVPGAEQLRPGVARRVPAERQRERNRAPRRHARGAAIAEPRRTFGEQLARARIGGRMSGRRARCALTRRALAWPLHGHLPDAGESGVSRPDDRPEPPPLRQHLLARRPDHRQLRPGRAGAGDDAARVAQHLERPSSQADLPDTIQHVHVPTLIVYADGDCDIFPSEQQELLTRRAAPPTRR